MKLKFIFSVIVFVGLIYSCNGEDKPSKEALVERITQMEDSLKGLQANLAQTKQIPNLTHITQHSKERAGALPLRRLDI